MAGHRLQAAGRGGGTGGPRRGGGPSPTGPSERDPPLEGLRGFGGRRARDTRALFAPRGGGPRGTGGGACGQRGGAAAAWRWAPRGAGVAPPHRLRHAMMHRSVWGGRQPCLGGSLPAPPAGRGAFGGGAGGRRPDPKKSGPSFSSSAALRALECALFGGANSYWPCPPPALHLGFVAGGGLARPPRACRPPLAHCRQGVRACRARL